MYKPIPQALFYIGLGLVALLITVLLDVSMETKDAVGFITVVILMLITVLIYSLHERIKALEGGE